MTALAVGLVMVSICIVNAYPLGALGLGFLGYGIAHLARRRWIQRHSHVLTHRNMRCILKQKEEA